MSGIATITLDQRVKAVASILAGIKNADQATISNYETEVYRILDELGVTEVTHLDDAEITQDGAMRHAFGGDHSDPNKLWGVLKPVTWRLVLSALRGGKQATAALDNSRLERLKSLGFRVGIKDAPTSALIDLYDPTMGQEDPVTNALKQRFGGQKVILFKPGAGALEIDREATKAYITDLSIGHPERDIVVTTSGPTKPVAVGVVPNQTLDEDPMFAGIPLSNHRSTVNFVNWEGVSHEARQFCRIVVEQGAIDPNNERASRELVTTASAGVAELRKFYTRPSVAFDERKAAGDLPKLTIVLDKATRTQDPFRVRGGNRQW